MIKRMTKATSLLVAAAAMVSLVPATSASAATKLANKEGTVESAIAFENGSYLYSGYRTDDDNQGVYYNAGDKDKALEDLEDATIEGKYGTKYAVAIDGNDEYIVDLSTGKASDEDTADELKSTLRTKLNNTLRKTDRYSYNKQEPVREVEQISEKQFGDVWYEYSATTSAEGAATGYTNQSAKYIDAGVTANMYAYDGTRMVKIEEFGKMYGTDDNVSATISNATTIAQDANYIYRVVEVNLTGAKTVKATKADGEEKATIKDLNTAVYLQKISKAQGSKEDDAYLPKSVESYEITDALNNSDVSDAYDVLAESNTGDNTLVATRVVDGAIYVTTFNSKDDEVTTTKLTLKKSEKIEADNLGKNVDVSVVKKSSDVDTDVAGAEGISVDVDGNVWVVYKGEISKSVKGGKFETVYTCDRTLNSLDVYNESNLIAWDSEGDVYTTVQEGKDASKDEANDIVGGDTNTDSTVKAGWVQNSNGTWSYNKADGAKATGWLNDNGTWYYLDSTGVMQTGWLNDRGTWYYLNGSGAMQTGWVLDNGTWYYCNGSGAMQTGWVLVNGTWYYMQSSGAMKTGWLNDNGTWYYLQSSGAMAANTTVDGYRLGSNGAWIR